MNPTQALWKSAGWERDPEAALLGCFRSDRVPSWDQPPIGRIVYRTIGGLCDVDDDLFDLGDYGDGRSKPREHDPPNACRGRRSWVSALTVDGASGWIDGSSGGGGRCGAEPVSRDQLRQPGATGSVSVCFIRDQTGREHRGSGVGRTSPTVEPNDDYLAPASAKAGRAGVAPL